MKKPYKIGLTGGIGSGKTTVAKIFQSLGVPVFNSDDCGRNLLLNNDSIIKRVKKIFGPNIFTHKKIDTRKLSSIVFSNKKKLKLLNEIIHPEVICEFEKWLQKQNTHYIIKESALLFESNTYHILDKIILIKAPVQLRILRVVKRDNRKQKDILNIIKNQCKNKEIMHKVDYIINNNEKKLLTPKIMHLNDKLRNLCNSSSFFF